MKLLPFKSFILIIILFLIFLIPGINLSEINGYKWTRQNTPVTSLLTKCIFTDSLTGWASGEEGAIIHTSDGGQTWSLQQSNISFNIFDISFVNSRLGWAVANDNFSSGTAVLSTTNGGVDWSFYRYPDSTFLLYSIYFIDSLNGYMGGYNGVILKTEDSGNNWSLCKSDTNLYSNYPVLRFSFFNLESGAAVGGTTDLAGVAWVTTNGGNYWTSRQASFEPVYDLQFFDSDNLIAAGGDFKFGTIISFSENSGFDWNFKPLNIFGIPKAISFRNRSEGWLALTFAGKYGYSVDSGKSWNTIDVPGNYAVYDIDFPDEYHGYSVGSGGSVFKYIPENVGINLIENTVPFSIELIGNYPNPFNPSTKIKFTVSQKSFIRLLVYNVLGSQVRSVAEGITDPGTYEADFYGSDLPGGIYFCRLESPEHTSVLKMILLK